MVVADSGGYLIEGHVKKYFRRRKVEDMTGIWQVRREGKSAGSGKQQRDGRRRDRGIGYRQPSGK